MSAMLWAAMHVLTTFALDLPAALPVGKDYYLVGPAVRLGRFITNERFSRDGRYVTFIDESPERSYPLEREAVQRGDYFEGRALVRQDLQNGIRQVLYEPKADETLMDVIPIGTGGDIVCTIAVGKVVDDKNGWKALFCPVGEQPRIVCDKVRGRSFQVAASTTEPKAVILVSGLGTPTRYIYLTQDNTIEKEIGLECFQSFFFPSNSVNRPIAAFQGLAPDYKLLAYLQFVFSSGSFAKISDLPKQLDSQLTKPLFTFDTTERSKGVSILGQVPLNDLIVILKDEKDKKKFLIVSQGIINVTRQAENGLAVIYLKDDGYYLREMVKADPSLAEKLKLKK